MILDGILYVLWLLMIVALVFFGFCALLVFLVTIALIVRGIRELRNQKCPCDSVEAPGTHSDAEDDELPFSDFEEQE